MQNNGTLLHEVTLKISTNYCFRISVTRAFSILQGSKMQISIQYSDEYVQVKRRYLRLWSKLLQFHGMETSLDVLRAMNVER